MTRLITFAVALSCASAIGFGCTWHAVSTVATIEAYENDCLPPDHPDYDEGCDGGPFTIEENE